MTVPLQSLKDELDSQSPNNEGGEERRRTRTAWDSTIGKHNLLDSQPKYSFGKGTRDGLRKMLNADAGTDHPGPIYNIPSSIGELAKSQTIARASRNVSYQIQTPSPGPMYHPSKIYIPDTPSFSVPKQPKDPPNLNNDMMKTPSPVTYFPNEKQLYLKSPSYPFGGRYREGKRYYSKLLNLEVETPSPGSGAYNPSIDHKKPGSVKQTGMSTSIRPPCVYRLTACWHIMVTVC